MREEGQTMKVMILGSGVIGVTSAWYLAKAGHEVTVVDRQPEAALETSFANAGQVSPGYSAPWAAPGVPLKAIKWMMQDLAPLRLSPTTDPSMYSWLFKMLMNCNEKSYRTNKARMLRVAEYSRDCLKNLRDELSLDYDQRTQGTLQLFRTQKQVDASLSDIAILEECGVTYEALDRDGCMKVEPGLRHVPSKFVGGLRLPGDETGDCFKFTQALAKACEEAGVVFQYDTEIDGLLTTGDRIDGVRTSEGLLTADRYLVAMGSYSSLLLKTIGINAPIYPVKGYSITIPLVDEDKAPQSTVMDETFKIAITRLNDRIRVGGTAEICGYNLKMPADRQRNVNHSVSDLFPGAGDLSQASFWTGLRPMTPDGTPILGGSKFRNLFINSGHGTLGWTMSTGSAKYIADVISGHKPEISSEGLGIDRYGSARAPRLKAQYAG
ncbi:D-amino acid dehydrogenase [Hahella ganghwensis]|uniref:D-amino acid dehydrogenase n=1 Tax=Hahella ganghwensis TaxID=286420 RepID=UPI00316AEDCE